MKKETLLSCLIFCILLPFSGFAQEKPIVSRAQAKACEKQTRQEDGNPGKNYWQNSSDYYIQVSVDVENKKVNGQERIVYYNNSPDSLKTIVIRLYQDLYKKGANRNSIVDVNPLDVTDGVRIESLKVNGATMDLSEESSSVKRAGTLMYVFLNKKLAPHGKLELQIAWSFDFPQQTLIRMGTIDNTSLFVGQWYPQIAVYDDITGWDTRSYYGMAEFYNDFCNFEVEITVPEKFMVWATGEPQNLNEMLQPQYYDKYKKASVSDDITHVITEEDLKSGTVTTSKTTWKYKASNVPDFAFGISDHYLWDVTSVVVDKKTGRRTVVGVAYNTKAPHFDKVISIARETVWSLSEEMPGIPYPYPYLTVYNGDFGMEYPMITNVGADEDYGMTVYANSHEIAHAYFPFYVGTNETGNGWIDEGLTVYLPEKMQSHLSPDLNIGGYNTSAFQLYAGINGEPPLITPTNYLNPDIYFYMNYAKAEQALRMLDMQLGHDLFKKCLLAFMDRWKYKHPTALDFFNTFSNVSGQNLNWYWMAWYYQCGGIPDLAITSVTQKDKQLAVTVENKGDLPLPIELTFYNGEKPAGTVTKPATAWLNNQTKAEVTFTTSETITRIVLGSDTIPDANAADNMYEMR